MTMRHNDHTGMFEDVPSFSDRLGRIGQFFGRLMRFAFKVCCWTLGLGLVAGLAYVYRSEILSGTTAGWDHLRRLDFDLLGKVGNSIGAICPYLFGVILLAVIWRCRRLIWAMIMVPIRIVFYPFIKWWGIAKAFWKNGDRFMACVMAFPGIVLVGLYRLVFTIVFSVLADAFNVSGSWDALKMFLAIGGFVLFVVFYGRALAEAQHGSLVVYRDWGDFTKSAVWVIAVPVSVAWVFEEHGDLLFRCAGLALLVVGAVSFCTMVSGAFKYNSGAERWLALFARIGVILMLMFALGRLQDKLDKYKRGELGVIRGVLIPLAVFAWMFNYLIRPMIRTERCRLWS